MTGTAGGAMPHGAKPTQHYLNISDIKDDILVLRNGELRQVLEVTALNFALKSEEEQAAIIYQYQALLNSLQFPIQILVQSRRLDLTHYLASLQERMSQVTSPLIRNQIADYVDFIGRLINLGGIMEKKFYVIIPFATSSIHIRSWLGQLFKRETIDIPKEELQTAKERLAERADTLRSALGGIGLRARPLAGEELKQVLYRTYNPVEAGEIAPGVN